MKKIFFFTAAFLMSSILFAQDMKMMMKQNKDLSITKSSLGFDMTVQKLKNALKEKELPIFAEINHKKNAEEVGLSMNPATVIIFGNPKVGTDLMIQKPLISLDLPLKISIIETDDKSVLIVFTKPEVLARRYNIKGSPLISKVQMLMENLAAAVSRVN